LSAARALSDRFRQVVILDRDQLPDDATPRPKGVSAYVGDGLNRWPAAHVLDTARLYRLALEKQDPGAKYHAVAEEGVPLRDIAEVIGRP
jgi:nucleoside-diphosphate-sugar epimerase